MKWSNLRLIIGIILFLVIIFLLSTVLDKNNHFCQSKGYYTFSTDTVVEKGYILCCGKYVNHVLDFGVCEVFEYKRWMYG
jgi:hypothetical protein